VQKTGNRIRIIVQLIETEGGTHVWNGRHDGTIDDIFDLQDRITEQVAGALQPSIREVAGPRKVTTGAGRRPRWSEQPVGARGASTRA
jgi:hypothetical protein